MSNPTFKPSEGKREEFRKYLEKNGVMDALTKVLVNLYEEPEKPEDALEYIRDRLAVQAGFETHAQMKSKLEEFQNKVDTLTQELDQLKVESPQGAPVEDEAANMNEEKTPSAPELPPTEEPVAEDVQNEEPAPE